MALKLKVDESSFSEGRIHLRGWCFDDRLPIRKVEAVFPEPLAFVQLVSFGLPSPDVAKAVNPKAGNNRFDESVAIPSRTIGREFRLQFTLSDGTIVLGEFDIGNSFDLSKRRFEVVPDVETLQMELDVVARRESEFRTKMVMEFLDRGESNTYLHTLRQERAALVSSEREASARLESLTRKLEFEWEKTAATQSELERIKGSMSWRLMAPVRAIERMISSGSK